jgi:LuxR family transcriptional regulator
MLTKLIPDYDKGLARMREIAPAGFVLAFNINWSGPEHLHSEFPAAWKELYERKNYFVADPIFYWTLVSKGRKRWSEIALPDVAGVLASAKAHGMHYGAVFSERRGGRRSFLTAAHPEREFEEPEMAEMGALFNSWVDVLNNRPTLSQGELDVLACLRDGMAQSDIATKLKIAESTVKQRARRAMSKLGAATRTQAVALAVAKNYFD